MFPQLRRTLLAGLLATLAITAPVIAQEPASATDSDKSSWMDASHDRVVRTADDLANWADDFFGNPQSDLESAAASRIRLRPEFSWDEQDDTDWKLRASGRLRLPKVNERLSLVFFSNEDDIDQGFYDPALASAGESTVGLQLNIQEEKHSRVDIIAGAKSGPKGKLATRYRYQAPFWERNRARFSEELFWIGGDGFGVLTRLDLDHKWKPDTLIRWANKAEYSEESNGVEWNSRLAWIRKIDEKSAVRAFGFIRGDTDPDLLKSRGFGAAYRRNFMREWLYWEIEPRYAWRKNKPHKERDGVASIRFRIEILFSSE